jgi:ferrous iron transport protein B
MHARVSESHIPHIAIAGNPNSGKSTVFNALTGLRQKTANYPGVTVEKREGTLRAEGLGDVHVIDLPGTYSLSPRSPDEEIAHDVLLGLLPDTPKPCLVVSVVDAGNLERNLFFTSQLVGAGHPVIVALNMTDLAAQAGIEVDAPALSRRLGVPVIPMVASRRLGVPELREAIFKQIRNPRPADEVVPLPAAVSECVDAVAGVLTRRKMVEDRAARGEALRLISSENALEHLRFANGGDELAQRVRDARHQIEAMGVSWSAAEAEARYRWIEETVSRVRRQRPVEPSPSDRLDRVFTHRIFGPIAFLAIMLLLFVALFRLSQPAMNGIEHAFGWLADATTRVMPAGPLRDLLTNGVLAGVGSVLVFLPQILLLFLFIAALEDSGYMARVAFIMDRVMGRVGLPGRSFIPFLSSFACAIPGIMGARTIENPRDRLATILVAPLMCCSARWPVYFLLVSAVIPAVPVFGFIPLPALVIVGLVAMGIVAAIVVAAAFKRTILRSESSTAVLELPRYRVPSLRTILHVMLERGLLFVRKAGTVILAMSIIMWALATYPRLPEATPGEQIRASFAGRLGRVIEPAIAPLGFDWRIGIAIISSLAAREVFVSTMGTIYGVSVSDPHTAANLQELLRTEINPATGGPFFTPLRGISLMVFYVLAMQCFSTTAVVRRETGGWKWALFQWGYMTALAWLAGAVVWNGGRLLGWS